MTEVRYVSPEGWEIRGYMYWRDNTIPGHWEGTTPESAEAQFAEWRKQGVPPKSNPPAGGEGKPEPDWRDDPSADDRWNAGCEFAMQQLCAWLHVDPQTVSWDAATETLDGDVQAVIGNILRARMGDDWSPLSRSGDSALVEAVRLLAVVAEYSHRLPPDLETEIDKFIRQHGERK